MDRRFNLIRRFCVVLACVLALSACQQLKHNVIDLTEHERSTQKDKLEQALRWWRASFQMDWDKAASPHWHLGPLIAEQVILPVLQHHGGELRLWRFHRRAVGDAGGHRFSFLYYTDSGTAANVEVLIRQNVILQNLRTEGVVSTVSIGPYGSQDGVAVSATSDPRWTAVMQKTWPHFLMGVSRMWLEQVILFSEKVSLESSFEEEDLDGLDETGLEEHYIKVQSELSGIWLKEGKHAYLHHLNAVYAYQPMFHVF